MICDRLPSVIEPKAITLLSSRRSVKLNKRNREIGKFKLKRFPAPGQSKFTFFANLQFLNEFLSVISIEQEFRFKL